MFPFPKKHEETRAAHKTGGLLLKWSSEDKGNEHGRTLFSCLWCILEKEDLPDSPGIFMNADPDLQRQKGKAGTTLFLTYNLQPSRPPPPCPPPNRRPNSANVTYSFYRFVGFLGFR